MRLKVLLLSLLILASAGGAFAQNNARMLSTPNAQTGTTYTFVAADATRITTFSNASPVAATLPNGATLGFGAGTLFSVANIGAGAVTITCTSCTISANGVTAATLVLSQGQGADIYGGIGSPAVNYVALPSPSGTFANITATSLTVSGTGTVLNLNDILWVGPGSGSYNTVAAAVTAAGSVNKTIIALRSTFTGTCPASTLSSTNPNITIWDFTGTCNPSVTGSGYQGSSFNHSDGNVQSLVRHGSTFSAFPGTNAAVVTGYFITQANNFTVGSGNTVDGISAEADFFGTFSGTLLGAQSVEHDWFIGSTGGTITNLTAGVFYGQTGVGSTTAVTNASGIRAIGCKASLLGSIPTNCYGGIFEDQPYAGSTRNYSIFSKGAVLIGYSTNTNSSKVDFEDSSHTVHQTFAVDSSGLFNFQSPTASGIGLEDNSGNLQATVLGTGVKIFNNGVWSANAGLAPLGIASNPFAGLRIGTAATNNFFFSPAATAAARTINVNDTGGVANVALPLLGSAGTAGYQTKRVASCTTAAAAGSTCTTTVTWTTAFADTSYTATCSIGGVTNVPYVLNFSQLAASVTVTIANLTAAAASGTIHCEAQHD